MQLRVFCLLLPQSDSCFIKAYPARPRKPSSTGSSLHLRFSAACRSRFYMTISKSQWRIFGDGKRQCTRAFTELVSHYLFQERFGRPGKGNDKGKVEAMHACMQSCIDESVDCM